MEVDHEDWVIDLSEEPFQYVGHVLDEVVPDPQLDVSSVSAELLHQQLDPGFGSVLPVDAFVTQTCTDPERLRSHGSVILT